MPHSNQPPASRWPFGNENATTRSRRAALAYRAALRLNNRQLCDQIDQTLTEYGETWVTETEVTVDPDGLDELTTAEAAGLAHVPEYEIRRWATLCACPSSPKPHPPATAHPDAPVQPLLPRFARRGHSTTYLARDVVAAAEKVRGPVGLPPIESVR